MLKNFSIYNKSLLKLKKSKALITTINAHCYNITLTDKYYQEALLNSDVLIPDGISIVFALRWLTGKKIKKIAGEDLFFYELKRLQNVRGKCFFLGSTDATLEKIKERIEKEYSAIQIQTYSPPYKPEFSNDDNFKMLDAINSFQPDVLMIGMTAPKQEKWAYLHFNQLQVGHICCIGAVFDFYAGTISRAPQWMIKLGLEWFYRLIKEPRRLWRRYLLGNILFISSIIKEKKQQNKMITKLTRNKIHIYILITSLLLIIPYIILFFQSDEQMVNFTKEDGIIENLSAIYYFIASTICLLIFLKTSSPDKIYFLKSRRNYFILILGIFFFLCFGEEISWGQRIFNVPSTDTIIKLNYQHEMNLHNLRLLKPDNINGHVQIGIQQWTSPEGIFILIWLFYCLLIPLLDKLSNKTHNFITKIHFPLLSIWIGILFFIHQLVYEGFKAMEYFPVHPLAEIKETNCAFLFLIASISLYGARQTKISSRF